jgi:hypothetical protein
MATLEEVSIQFGRDVTPGRAVAAAERAAIGAQQVGAAAG